MATTESLELMVEEQKAIETKPQYYLLSKFIMCPAPGVLYAAFTPSQRNYKNHRKEQKSSKIRNCFNTSRNTESWEAQVFKTRN